MGTHPGKWVIARANSAKASAGDRDAAMNIIVLGGAGDMGSRAVEDLALS